MASKIERFERRRHHIRRTISGTPARPRLCIHKSLRHIYAQLIDDEAGRTLYFVKANKADGSSFCNMTWAKRLGSALAEQAKARGLESVVFDRSGYRYHGVVKAFGDAAREGGLKF